MVRHDDELVDLMHIQEHVKTIRHRGNEAELRVLAAESNTVGGSKSVGLLVDELHLFGQMSGAGSMFTEAQGGLAARPEGFIIWLTTQSDQPPTGVFREKLQYARDVRDGKIVDPEFVPIIYEFPDEMIDDDSFRDPDNFYIVNPNLGYSVDEAYLRREYKKAEVEGQESLQRFCAKHLNVEVGVNLRSDRWKGADHWEQCFVEPFSLDDLIKRCEVIEIGIDGGGLDDMLGFCVAGRITGTDDEWMTWEHAWIHTSVLELRKKEASRFEDFQQEGSLTIIETAGEDVSQVADIVKKCYDSGLLDKIGVDPHGLGGIIEAIEARDVPEDFILGVSQGWKMNGAIMTTERKLQAKKINHSGLKLMNWCVGNAKVKQVGNAKSITKQQSGSAKIDPLIALFNAISLLSLNPESKSGIDDFIMNPIKMR
jgi:phage terminase large subunit-like protein